MPDKLCYNCCFKRDIPINSSQKSSNSLIQRERKKQVESRECRMVQLLDSALPGS